MKSSHLAADITKLTLTNLAVPIELLDGVVFGEPHPTHPLNALWRRQSRNLTEGEQRCKTDVQLQRPGYLLAVLVVLQDGLRFDLWTQWRDNEINQWWLFWSKSRLWFFF